MQTPATILADKPLAPPLGRFLPYWRWLAPSAVYALLVVLSTLAGYWIMFSQFAVYDDEGFFNYTLTLFVDGHALYNSIWSIHGPFYYLVFGAFYSLVGHGITTDAGRLIQLTIWILTSLCLGLTAHRLTGRFALGVTSFATAFLLLNGMTSEPMHAAALICLLLSLILAAVVFVLPTMPRTALAAVGALAAALTLTKINVGGYVIVAIGFATVMASDSLVRHGVFRWLAAAGFVLVGPAVMASALNSGWVRMYAVLAACSTLALVAIALPRPDGPVPFGDSVRWPNWLIGGFVCCTAVVLGTLFALGTTPGAFIDLTIWVARRQSKVLTEPITLTGSAIWWSLGAVVLAWTWRQRGLADGYRLIVPPALSSGLLRVIGGLAILLSLSNGFVFNIAPNATFALAMPLAWIAGLPPAGAVLTPRERLARLLISSLAILYPLDAYPAAGTQVLMGSILLVPCGALCVVDGWAELTALAAAHPRYQSAIAALPALTVALAVGTVFLYVVQPLEVNHNQYRENTPLDVVGATRLHLNSQQGPALAQVVALVTAKCRTLISLPGMYSFNVWTRLPTPTVTVGEQAYWKELSHGQQVNLIRASERSRDLCLVRNDQLAASYGGATPTAPIVRYLDTNFRTIGQFPPYTVEVPRA